MKRKNLFYERIHTTGEEEKIQLYVLTAYVLCVLFAVNEIQQVADSLMFDFSFAIIFRGKENITNTYK